MTEEKRNLSPFGEELERQLLNAGIGKTELARRLKWQPARIFKVMKIASPYYSTIKRISDAIGVDPVIFQPFLKEVVRGTPRKRT